MLQRFAECLQKNRKASTEKHDPSTLKCTTTTLIGHVSGDFLYCKDSAILCTAKSTLFALSKDEWDTKEDTGKWRTLVSP